MPKKLLSVLTFAFAGVLAACGGHNNVVTITFTPTPLPTATAATLEATYKATPLPGITINMYASSVDENATPNPSASATAAPQPLPTGPVLQSQVTATDGTAVFSGLTPGVTYCWAINYVNGTATLSAHNCTNQWGYGSTLIVGT
jgi:hypothetical protein